MLVEMIQTGFMQNAFLAGIMISVVTSILGVFLVLKKLSLIGDGLAHASFGGIALGLLVGVNAYITGLIVAVLASLGIHRLMEKAKAYGDSAIALILSTGMAIAVVIISWAGGFTVDIFSYLFGSILTTGTTDLMIIFSVFLGTILYVLIFYKELVYSSFNEELAALQGGRTKLAQNIFIVLIALAVVISIRAVGILLVTALIVIPPLTALQISDSFKQSLIYSIVISTASMITGITLAYIWDLAPSGVIVLTMIGLFLLTYLYDYLEGL